MNYTISVKPDSRKPVPEKKKIYLSSHSQLRYLEVIGSIFTCTIMFRYTFVIPFPANTPKRSFSVMAQ